MKTFLNACVYAAVIYGAWTAGKIYGYNAGYENGYNIGKWNVKHW